MKYLTEILGKELSLNEINWENVEKILSENRNLINEEDDSDCALSYLFDYFYHKGALALKLIDLFVKYGFDVNSNNGRNGAKCLKQLCWAFYDQYIVEAAEKLLLLGADPNLKLNEDDEKGILGFIGSKLAYWTLGYWNSANIFEAYYEMAERAKKGLPYAGIKAFKNVVGEKISKVELLQVKDNNTEEGNMTQYYLFWCGTKQLIINNFIDIVVNPYIRGEALAITDITDEFKEILGVSIKNLRFIDYGKAKINLENNRFLSIGEEYKEYEDGRRRWIFVKKRSDVVIPVLGEEIEDIYLARKRSNSANRNIYYDDTLYLMLKDAGYKISAVNMNDSKMKIMSVEEIDDEADIGCQLMIDTDNITIEEVHLTDNIIDWIRMACNHGYIYITVVNGNKLSYFMSEDIFEDPSNMDSLYDNLIKIPFFKN